MVAQDEDREDLAAGTTERLLRRLIEARLAEIALLEAKVAQLKRAIARCHGCTITYRSIQNAPPGECVRRPPDADAYTGPRNVDSRFVWVRVEPSSC